VWINREVNLPEEVLSALEDGRLVVFAGAGVSMSPPASFPDFDELAARVFEQTDRTLERQKSESVDRYFGRLKKHGIEVHQLVKEMLSNPNSQPTDLHRALFSLFSSAQSVRVVTTNFDRHFTTAGCSAFGAGLPVYFSPAVPLGRKFEGLVNLHGCVEQSAENLVLTDEDFGRAYLTDGWATRFLLGMFTQYTVLFIGYSHGDPVMQYLARGLPPGTKRFVLAPAGNLAVWQHLDIAPIEYPLRATGEKHGALLDAVKAWVEFRRMGFGQHDERIKNIVERTPPLDPQAIDYVLSCLKQVSTLRFFADHAADPQWLRWVFDRGLLDRLFLSTGATSDTDAIFAGWIATRFACAHADEVFALLQERGQQINVVLWLALADHLWRCNPRPDPTVFGIWVGTLLRSAPPPIYTRDLLDYLLKECRFPEDAGTALILFDFLLAPLPEMERAWPRWTEGEEKKKTRLDVVVRGDHYWLNETWQKFFTPHLEAFAEQIIPIVTRHIQHAHSILAQAGSAVQLYDPVSRGRKAIEPHAQDAMPSGVDILIDAARDSIDHLLTTSPQRAESVMAGWEISAAPLLKRLSIYAVGRHPTMSADDKLRWLLQKDWLYAYGLRHEVFHLLKAAVPSSGEALQTSLLEQVLRGPSGEEVNGIEERLKSYETFNLICWLVRIAPSFSKATDERNKLQEANPDFQERSWLDFDSWSEVGHVELVSPITVDELLAKPLEEGLRLLLEFKGDAYSPGPNRYGLMSVATAAAAKDFDWGFNLAVLLKEKRRWESDPWSAVLGAWHDMALTELRWKQVLSLLKSTPEIYGCDYAVSRLLRQGVERGGMPESLLPEAEDIAESFYKSTETEANAATVDESRAENDWLQRAINHAGGRIVQFWLYALSIHRKNAGDSWSGLPDNYKRYFEHVTHGSSTSSRMGTTLLLSELAFLFAVDREWTRANLIPLLDWSSDKQRAQCAWHGLLWARLHKGLLPELWPFFEQSYGELSQGLRSRKDRFCDLLSEIAIFVSDNPLQEGWLFHFLSQVQDEDRRMWASYIEHKLRCAPTELRRKVWETWLNEYWSKRQSGIPVPPSEAEVHSMIEWAPQLEAVFPSVVDRICAKPVPDLKQAAIYYRLEHENMAGSHPEAMAKLLVHLLAAARDPFYHCYEAAKITEQLAQAANPPSQLISICDHLLRLGCNGVAEIRRRLAGTSPGCRQASD